MTMLPAAAWTQRSDLADLVAALGSGSIRWVGGAVRDTLLGSVVADVDAATTHLPDAAMELLNNAGIRTIPTGIEHGTLTAILPGGNVEITTLRHDVSTDGRRATVRFADNWEDDAARRDFTINALYADPETREIYDYFGGLADLEQRRVRFIGDARERIREDHLRIMRYFRFKARFGSNADEEAESACADLAETLKGLSRERVAMELLNLLGLPNPVDAVQNMAKLGVLQVILPEAGAEELAALQALLAIEHASAAEPFALRRLSALLPADAAVAVSVASRLKMSRKQKKHLSTCAKRTVRDAQRGQALAYRYGKEIARDRMLLMGADASALDTWDLPILPLKGGEIVARGVSAGPEVARILQTVESRWVAEGFPPRKRVEEMLAEELKG